MMVWGIDVGEGWRIAAGILDAGFDGDLVGLEGWVGGRRGKGIMVFTVQKAMTLGKM